MKISDWRFTFLLLLFGVFIGCLLPATSIAMYLGDGGGINDHPHNLSSSSTATIHSNTEDRICIFCHTPHGSSARGPLWNRNDPIGPNGDGTFPLYADVEPGLITNVDADYGGANYPNGSTRLCLSCHDGVTAIAEVISGGNLDPALGNMVDEGSTLIIDLSAAHPVSFIFNSTIATDVYGTRFDLTNLLPGLLDGEGRLQCASCHDPHTDTYDVDKAGTYDLPMWRHYTGSGNQLTDYNETCESCHKIAPNNISHN